MARARDPNYEKAKQMYLDSKGEMKLIDIAAAVGKSDVQIRKWKSKNGWDDELNSGKGTSAAKGTKKGNVTIDKGNVPNEKERAEKAENKAKIANEPVKRKGGNPNPQNQFTERNQAALKHGLFSRYIPKETLELMDLLEDRSPADLIWDQIQIQYAAIIRAQEIMFVRNKEEMTRELKKVKYEIGVGETGDVEPLITEEEYEIQFAWDKQAKFLTAQSRAISELRTAIKQFINMAHEDDERVRKVQLMNATIDKTRAEAEKVQRQNEAGNQQNTEQKLAQLFTMLQSDFKESDEPEVIGDDDE